MTDDLTAQYVLMALGSGRTCKLCGRGDRMKRQGRLCQPCETLGRSKAHWLGRAVETPLGRLIRLSQVESSGCWRWTGLAHYSGYGLFKMYGRMWRAHRAAYTLLVGPIPDGLTLDHLCENKLCVNPKHLEPVTSRVNVLRSLHTPARINRDKTECPQGHPYDAANTYRRRTGRACRKCKLASERRHAPERNARRRAAWSPLR